MKTSEKINISLRKLVVLKNNPRKITQESLNRLCDSIRDNGYWEHRPAAVEPIEGTDTYQVLDGNQRLKAMRRLKRKDMPCVIYTELTDEERTDLILRSNVNNGEWNAELLVSDFAPVVDFDAIGLDFEMPTFEQLAEVVPSTTPKGDPQPDGRQPEETPAEETEADDETEQREEKRALFNRMLGDYLYPTDNDYEIPLLLADNQPVHLELPFAPWGAEARYKKGITTYHFYVDDYRFEALYKDPIKLLESGCRAVVEPNNSIHDQTPAAYAIWQIYRKRYLARYLQECGLQVWVDLNVSPKFEQLNAKGIPQGYNAFFTRDVSGWQPTLDRHLQMAQRISGLEHPNLCVYGGGDDIRQWCHEKGVLHVQEYMNRGREK
jgi:hypothetical protein